MKIYPSLTSQIAEEVLEYVRALDPWCHGFHIDYMDGNFVPATMGNAELINEIRTITNKQLWIHCMANNPLPFIETLQLHPHDRISFHTEIADPESIIAYCKEHQLQASATLNPKTSMHTWARLLYTLHHVTIMSVEPGKSGQLFLESTWQKLQDLQALRIHQGYYFTIAVDGGVSKNNIVRLADYGVNEVAVCNSIFKKNDPVKALQELNELFVL